MTGPSTPERPRGRPAADPGGDDHPILAHPRLALLQFIALFAFWIALSWRTDPIYIAIGLVSAGLITIVSQRLTSTIVHADRPSPPWRRIPVLAWRFVAFAVWLIGRMVVAGVQIAQITLSRRLPIDPVELRFTTQLASPMARTVFTNAITLVPGTLTVDIDDDQIVVHALYPSAADDLIDGTLQNRVAALFDEPPQPPLGAEVLDLGQRHVGDPDPTDSTGDEGGAP